MKLNKEDFNVLDRLLTKMGFGSYYDCIQLLKDIIYKIRPKLQCKLEKETDLYILIMLLARLPIKNTRELIAEFLQDWQWGDSYGKTTHLLGFKYPSCTGYWEWFEKKWEKRLEE